MLCTHHKLVSTQYTLHNKYILHLTAVPVSEQRKLSQSCLSSLSFIKYLYQQNDLITSQLLLVYNSSKNTSLQRSTVRKILFTCPPPNKENNSLSIKKLT